MSPSQLTEFLSYIFYSICNRTDMDELESRLSKLPAEIDRYISNINQNPQNEPLSAEQAIKIFELYYEKYSWLSRLNWHEEALDAVKDALLYFNVIGQFEERNDCTLYTCIIGNGPFPYDTIEYYLYADLSHTLLMLGRLNESIMFYHSLYDRKLKYIEQNCIWPGFNFDGLDETERYAETVAYIAEYCRWVEEYCRLLSLARQGNKANQLLDQAIRTMKNITILKKEDSFFYLEQLEYCKKEIPL